MLNVHACRPGPNFSFKVALVVQVLGAVRLSNHALGDTTPTEQDIGKFRGERGKGPNPYQQRLGFLWCRTVHPIGRHDKEVPGLWYTELARINVLDVPKSQDRVTPRSAGRKPWHSQPHQVSAR